MRSGAGLEALDELDVQAIAPDRTLTVEVPEPRPYVDRAFDAQLPDILVRLSRAAGA